MSYTPLQLNQAFQDVLRRRNGWAATGLLSLCDRCGAPQRELIQLGLPPDILLGLCPPCVAHVRHVMTWEGGGYLGEAYWLARAHLRLTPEGGQGPAGPA